MRATDRITLTAALRLDEYSDVGSFLSPRLAAVWRLDDTNILKAQYARAFRPPTFYELEYAATGDSIVAGEITTYELGYIRKQTRWEGRVILFQSDLTDTITFGDAAGGYINTPEARLRGVEIEYQVRLGPNLKLDGNLSYVDAVERDSGETLTGGTDRLANLALLWRPRAAWTAALQWHSVGERTRPPGDDRPALKDYNRLDLTLTYRRPGPGVFAHVGVKNLTDEQVRFPEIPTGFGGIPLTYEDDYPRPGRSWWLSVGYAF